MKTITSFTIDHQKLLPGIYVSRKDTVGSEVVTTFDIRMTRPNHEPVMNTAEMHTIEHLAQLFYETTKNTVLRSSTLDQWDVVLVFI